MNQNRSRTSAIVSTVLALALLTASTWAIFNRQYIIDQWTVWNYHPTNEVVAIADRSGMSDGGKFYLYASQTEVNDAATFNTNCERQEAKSAILGCYDGMNIYIYDVDNTQLDGIKEVTAAHEMLHAVWARMSSDEKARVTALLEAEYSKIEDATLKERMDYYDRNEPGERANELHSIIGTEIAVLDPTLEKYYSQYFDKRQDTTTLFATYNSVFSELKVASDMLLTEATALKSELEQKSAAYTLESDAVDVAYDDLKQQQRELDRSSQSAVNAYNAKVTALQARIAALNASRTAIIALQTTYNQKVEAYNKIVISSNALTQSIDSSLKTVPSL